MVSTGLVYSNEFRLSWSLRDGLDRDALIDGKAQNGWPPCTKHLDRLFFKLKMPKKVPSQKGQNMYSKAQFKNPKHLHQTTFKTSIYLQKMFWNCYLGQNVINLLKQKVAQKVAIVLGFFIFSKNHNEPLKPAQLAKNRPILSPWSDGWKYDVFVPKLPSLR